MARLALATLVALLLTAASTLAPESALASLWQVTGLHVTSRTDTSVSLDWDSDPSGTRLYYRLYTYSGSGALLKWERESTSLGTSGGLAPGTAYGFRASAVFPSVDGDVEGPLSSLVSTSTTGISPTPTPTPSPSPMPTPTPAPGAATWSCGWGTFDSDSRVFAGSCWRPYGDASWLNRLLPASARMRSNSAAMVSKTLNGANQVNTFSVGREGDQDWDHPYTAPDADDPVYTIHCWRYACPSIEGRTVRIPVGARPAQGTDRHLAVLDQAGGYVYDLYKMETDGPLGGSVTNWSKLRSPSGGTLYIGSGGRGAISGDGRDENADGANAAKTGLLAGPIRPEEMTAGVIPHALDLVVGCTSGTHVYPAQGDAGRCSDATNAPEDGAYFRLNLSDAQIDALPGPAWRRPIWRALAHYGGYVSDTGGGGSGLGIQPLSDRTYDDYGATGAWETFAAKHIAEGGITASSTTGKYYMDMASNSGVNLALQLVALDPCVPQGTC